MSITIGADDFGALCICALRYCHGRQTYMPSLIRDIIRTHLNELSNRDLAAMINDCRFQRDMDLYGDNRIDKPGWLMWEEELTSEMDRRKS